MKQTTILALILALAFSATAQTTNIQYGLKAGINASGLTGTTVEQLYNYNSWYAGAHVTLPFSKVVAFQPELLYSREGFRNVDSKYIFEFARMPLSFQLRHQSGFYADLGAQVGLRIKATVKNEVHDIETEIPDTEIFNAGIIMGVGYRHVSGIGANIRYTPSISKVGAETTGKLTTLSFGVSYSLESKKK